MSVPTHALSLFLGFLFLFTCSAKVWHPHLTIESLSHRGMNRKLAYSLWCILLAIEWELGLQFIFSGPSTLLLIFSGGLLFMYTSFLIWSWAKGDHQPCSCYGAWMVITPKEGLKLNSFYLLATAWLSLTPNLAWANTGLPLSFALVCALGIVRLKRK